jgi:hypothetical protein
MRQSKKNIYIKKGRMKNYIKLFIFVVILYNWPF